MTDVSGLFTNTRLRWDTMNSKFFIKYSAFASCIIQMFHSLRRQQVRVVN